MSTFSFGFQPDYCGVIDRHNCGRVLPARFQVKPCRPVMWEVFKPPTRRVSNSSKSPTTVQEASMRVPRCLLSPWMRDAVLGMSPTTLHAKCPLPPTLPKHGPSTTAFCIRLIKGGIVIELSFHGAVRDHRRCLRIHRLCLIRNVIPPNHGL